MQLIAVILFSITIIGMMIILLNDKKEVKG
jgi:hypothetical protein